MAMTEKFREQDNSIGKCVFCEKLVFKDEDWSLTPLNKKICHSDCKSEYLEKSGQMYT